MHSKKLHSQSSDQVKDYPKGIPDRSFSIDIEAQQKQQCRIEKHQSKRT